MKYQSWEWIMSSNHLLSCKEWCVNLFEAFDSQTTWSEVMKNCLDDISSDTFFFLSSLSNIWYYSWRLILCLVWSQKAKIGHERNGSPASMKSSPAAQQQYKRKDVKFTNFYKMDLLLLVELVCTCTVC